MDEIKLRGRYSTSCAEYTEILIAPLSQSELANLKEGDEVLVKCKVRDVKYSEGCIVAMAHHFDNIIAILPSQPAEEYCKCKEPDIYRGKDRLTGCTLCGKPLPPKPKQEVKWSNTIDNSFEQFIKNKLGQKTTIETVIHISAEKKDYEAEKEIMRCFPEYHFDFITQGLPTPKPEKEIKEMNCPKCNKKMKNIRDPITKKISKHLFACKCLGNKIIYKG